MERSETENKQKDWKKSFKNVWDYYKWAIIVLIAAVVFGCVMLVLPKNGGETVLFEGVTLNITLNEQACQYITDGYAEHLEAQDGDKVRNSALSFGDPADPELSDYNYAAAMQVLGMVTAKQLDYAIMDQASCDYYMNQDIYADLTQVLTAEQLEEYAEILVYRNDADRGEYYPVAVCISDAAIIRDSGIEEAVYISFPYNTENKERSSDFFDWLMAWE